MAFDTKQYEEKMKKNLSAFEAELNTIRAGRANPSILDKVFVDYYGTPTAISAVAEIKVTDARTIVITPWDSSTVRAIEKGISASDLGLTPQNDGKVLRISIPPLTEERRRDITKQIAKYGEEAKVSLRSIRRDANEKAKELKKKSELTEDDLKQSEKQVQDLLDKYIKNVDAVVSKKEKEIMEI